MFQSRQLPMADHAHINGCIQWGWCLVVRGWWRGQKTGLYCSCYSSVKMLGMRFCYVYIFSAHFPLLKDYGWNSCEKLFWKSCALRCGVQKTTFVNLFSNFLLKDKLKYVRFKKSWTIHFVTICGVSSVNLSVSQSDGGQLVSQSVNRNISTGWFIKWNHIISQWHHTSRFK